jgi:hypothetical protein
MRIPNTLIAGDSAKWRDVSFQDALGNAVASADYALTYSFRGPRAGLDLVGVSYGSGWEFSLSTAQSAALNAGKAIETWFWTAVATKTDVRVTAGDGTLIVKPNLPAISTAGYDGRSQAEKDLAAVQLEISTRIKGGATRSTRSAIAR